MAKCRATNAAGQQCPFENLSGTPYCGHHSPRIKAAREALASWRGRNKGGRPKGFKPPPKEGRRPHRVVIMVTDTELEALDDQAGERARGLVAHEIFTRGLWS